jgi:hypothetical protein
MPSGKLSIWLILIPIIVILLWQCPDNPVKPDNNTADTTSHNFTWQTWTFGDFGSSHFRDVAIVDKNNIWAVGEIFVDDPDSSWNGTGWETFNAAHWNGVEWEYIHIRGTLTYDVGPLFSIWYFDENNIWVSTGFPVHWDGNNWTLYHLQNMGIDASAGNAIWASSPDDIYFVGRKGSIVHYDGSKFTKVESGTTLPINDIWGAYNSKTKQYEILAVASNRALNIGRKVLKISGNQVTAVADSGLPCSISSIFFPLEENTISSVMEYMRAPALNLQVLGSSGHPGK